MTLQLSWNATENTIHSEQEAADSSLKMDGTGRVVPCDLVEGLHLMPSRLATATSSFTATRAEDWAEDITRISSPSGTTPWTLLHLCLNILNLWKWQPRTDWKTTMPSTQDCC